MPLTLRVTEIFHSLQGEGFHAGKPATFIRMAGCNLACMFCDTDFSLKARINSKEIVKKVLELSGLTRYVVITGGEPTIQSGVSELVKQLQSAEFFVSIETNGTSENTMGANWVTVSPKVNHGGEWKLRQGQELKLIFEGQNLQEYEKASFDHFFLQPKEIRTGSFGVGERDHAATKLEWEKTTAAVLANPRWRLSFQLHKELGLR